MFVSKLTTFRRNLNVIFRERLKIQKAPNMKITFTCFVLHHQNCSLWNDTFKLHLNEEFQFNYYQQEMNILGISSSDML